MPGAVQVLGSLQWGGHEKQEGPVYAMNGGQVAPAAVTDSCLSLGASRCGVERHTHSQVVNG